MTQSVGPKVVPNFVRAASLIGLRRSMLLNNIKLGGYVNYFQITQFTEGSKKYWIAWFYDHVAETEKVIGAEVSE